MIQLIGGSMVLCACVGGALALSAQRRRGLALGEELCRSLTVMERELGRFDPETAQLLRRGGEACTGEGQAFYRRVLRRLEEEPEAGLARLWRQEGEALPLPSGAAKAFLPVGALLGRYDALAQRAGLREAAGAMGEELQSAKEEESRESSLRLALGSCAAVFLLALLL